MAIIVPLKASCGTSPAISMTAERTAPIQSAGAAAVIVLSGHTASACTRSVPLPLTAVGKGHPPEGGDVSP